MTISDQALPMAQPQQQAPEPAPPADDSIEALAGRFDEALARRDELDPLPRQIIDDALAASGELHKKGLMTIVRALRDDPRGKELLFALVDEPEVRMLLSTHGIIRAPSADPLAAAERALEAIRPGIRGHGGDVELDRIEDGTAYVRLRGACNGCSMAAVTMREGVEKALCENVPEVSAVEVLPNDPAEDDGPAPLLQITKTDAGGGRSEETVAGDGPGPGWVKTFPAERIAVGTLEAMSLTKASGEGVEVIAVNAGGRLAAYINACAHQGMPLDNAIVDADEGTLTCPWHGFCYDSTNGECLTAPGAQLEQLPLRIDGGHIWIQVGS